MTSKVFRKQSTDGFSLIELIITITIVGILAAVVAPSWIAILNNQRATAVRDHILQVLRHTQADSIRTKRPRTVILNPSAIPPTITVTEVVPPTSGSTGITQALGENRLPPQGFGVRATDATGTALDNMITFDESGMLVRIDNSGVVSSDMRLPIAIQVSVPPTSGAKRCLIIDTLLGATRSVNKGQDPLCPS